MSRPLILWGVHPAHGPLPLKIAEWSRAEQRRRESEGWTCAVYAQGDAPVGLALVTASNPAPDTSGDTPDTAPGGQPVSEDDEDDVTPDYYDVLNARSAFKVDGIPYPADIEAEDAK